MVLHKGTNEVGPATSHLGGIPATSLPHSTSTTLSPRSILVNLLRKTGRASLVRLERVPMGKPLPRRRQPGAVTPQLRPAHPLFACGRSVSVTSRRNRSGRCCVTLQPQQAPGFLFPSRLVSHTSSTRVEEGSRHRATELDLGASLLPGGPQSRSHEEIKVRVNGHRLAAVGQGRDETGSLRTAARRGEGGDVLGPQMFGT